VQDTNTVAEHELEQIEETYSDEQQKLIDAAREAEAEKPERAPESWRKAVQAAPEAILPRLELARVQKDLGRWNGAVDALNDAFKRVPEEMKNRQRAIMFELIDIYKNHMKLDVKVLECYKKLLVVDPTDLRILDEAAEHLAAARRYTDLIKVLKQKAEAVSEPQDKAAVYLEIAKLYEERNTHAESVNSYEAVLEFQPTNVEALTALKRLYEKRRDWEKLIHVYEREIDQAEDEQARFSRSLEVARLATEKLRKPELAVSLWEKVLDLAPGNAEALEHLEQLYKRQKSWGKLATVLEQRVEHVDDPAKVIEVCLELGVLFTDRLEDRARAIEAWKRLLVHDPQNRRAQDALKKLYLAEKDWEALDAFYSELENWEEYIRVLDRQVNEEEKPVQLKLYFKIASLWLEKVDRPERAVGAYDKILGIDPENLDAAEALIPIFEQAKNYKKLARVLEIQADHTEDRDMRLERMRTLAGLYESSLRDPAAAMTKMLQAFEDSWEDGSLREEIERLAGVTGQWAELVASYEQACDKFSDPAASLPVRRVISEVYEQKLDAATKAIEATKAILEIAPEEEAALGSLERLYRGIEDWDSLLDIYERMLTLASDEDRRKRILFSMAEICEKHVGKPQEAIAHYRAVLDMGDDLEALRALDRLYEASEAWEGLADVIERQLLLVSEDEVSEVCTLKYRLGQFKAAYLGDAGQAVEQYREILDLNSAHEEARKALELCLEDPDLKLEASKILEPIYEAAVEWESLIAVLEIQAGGSEDATQRVDLLLKIGNLWGQSLGDTNRAFDAYSRAFQQDASRAEAQAALVGICEIEENWQALVDLYEQAIEGDAASSVKRGLLTYVADVYDTRLEEPDKAVEAYRKAQDIDPDDAGTLDALEKLYTKKEQWPALLDVYARKVDLSTDPDERLRLLFQIAYLQEEMLDDTDAAVQTYREIVAASPENRDALRALDRLYTKKEAWRELADNVARQLELAEDDVPAQVELLNRLAALRLQYLDEIGAAIETYRRILDLDSENDLAIQALESLLDSEEYQLSVAEVLEPIYRMRDEWEKSVRVYEVMVHHAYEPAKKLEYLHQIGELYEIAGDDAQAAFNAYGRALAEDPAQEETRQRLERITRELGNWEALVELYEAQVEESMDPTLAVGIWMRVAQILETQVDDSERAGAAYFKVLEQDPQYIEAANALEQLFTRTDDSKQLVGVLLKKMEIVSDIDEKKRLCYRAARIQSEEIEDEAAAVETYRKVLEIDEADETALDALEGLYVGQGRWEDLKDVYLKKAELAATDEDRKRMLYVLGQVYDAELHDLDRAIETYRSILDIDGEDLEAIQALDRLYFQAENWYELLSILEREVDLAAGTAEVVGLRHRIGALWEQQMGDLGRAVDTYRDVLSLDPTHEPTLAALERIAHGDTEPMLAAQVLEPVYRDELEWEKLSAIYEVLVAHVEDSVQKVEHLHTLADLYEQQLDDAVSAFGAFSRAFQENPTDEQTLAQLERLAGNADKWAELADVYEAQLDKILDSSLQVDILLRIARVYEEELDELDGAVEKYQRALEHDPESVPAIQALDRLFQRFEKWESLTEVLRREISMANTDDEIIAGQFRLGQVYEQNLGDMDNALECYREVLDIDPEHTGTLSALELLFAEGVKQQEIGRIVEPLYTQGGEWEKLVKVLEVLLGQVEDLVDRMASVQRIAEICEQQLFDKVEAFRWWGRGFVEDPTSELATEELERLAEETGSWDELAEVYEKVASGRTDEEGLVKRVLLRKATVCELHTNDQAGCEEALLRVLRIDPDEVDALSGLDRLYSRAQMHEELADVLARRVKVADGPDEAIELQFRIAELQEVFLENLDAAVTAYKAVLDEEMRNLKALEGLEKIYFQREQWKELYGVYEQMLDVAASDSEMAECYARMAKIASDALDAPDDAKQKWHQVLDLRGDDPVAFDALADLYEDAEQWQELVEVLERQVDAVDSDDGRIRLYYRLGGVLRDRLNQDREAIDTFHRILDLDPTNVDALYAVAALYRQIQAWEELSETLYRLVDLGTTVADLSDEQLLDLYSQLGELQGAVLMRPDDAIEAWQRVLDLDPANFKALGELETLFTQEMRWEECISVLERKVAALEEAQDQIDILMQMASIWEDKVGEPMKAATVYERVLEVDASHELASEHLERIYRENWEWGGLVKVLERRLAYLPSVDDQVATLHEIGKIFEENMDPPDLGSAFEYLMVAFALHYTNETTAQELERLATATNRWNELLTQYNEKAEEETDVQVKCNLLVKIGRWYASKLSRPDYAMASLQQALQLDPNNKDALSGLADYFRTQMQWPELVQTLGRLADLEDDPVKLAEVYLALADLYEDKLASMIDPNQAMQLSIQSYQKALEADQNNEGALAALERLYRTYQQWDPLIDILKRKVDLTTETDRVIEQKMAIGELYEDRLDDAYKAISAYKDILEVDPQNLDALKALERLYEKTGQMEEYLDVLEQELDYVGTDDERVGKYRQMAAVWEEHFDKVDRAAECHEKILLINETDDRAYASLERLYRQEGRWEDLVDTYDKHINAISSPADRIELSRMMGDILERQLHDVDRAIDAYRAILDYDDSHVDALMALSRLLEQVSDWDNALEMLQRLARLIDDPDQQVELYHRMGHILEEAMSDVEGAEMNYMRALELNPAYVPSMTALTDIYKGRSEWLKAAKMMVTAEEHTNNLLDRTSLLHEAGMIYLERIEDRETAMELLAKVLEVDPEHVAAAEPLSNLYFEDGRYEDLEPILDMLVRKSEDKDNRALSQLYYRAAKTAHELGNADKALKFYQMAYDLDSTHLPTLKGMAKILYDQEQWDRSFKVYQTILVHHREAQADQEITDIFYRLGNIKLQLGETKKALNMYEKALEVDPGHKETLLAVIDLQSKRKDWEAVIHAKRALLNNDLDARERFTLLEDIGDIYNDRLNNSQKAIAAYQEAIDIDPDDHSVLQKVLERYYDSKQWKKAIGVIDRFIEMESDPAIRAKYSYTAAAIYRDELKALDEAVEYFNKTLDDNWEHLKAFQAIDRVCTQKKDWKALERNYRAMIKRMPQDKNVPLLTMLWHNLGEIYRTRLHNYENAIAAFDVAAKLETGNIQRHQILAELYEMVGTPEALTKAIGEYQVILKSDPRRVEVYKKLFSVYREARQYDKAWCVASALAFHRKADPQETQLFEEYRQKGLVRARQRVGGELWTRNIFHPDEARIISGIFALVAPALGAAIGHPLKHYRLKLKERRDLATDQLMFSKLFNYASQVLNLEVNPDLYLKPDQPIGFMSACALEKGQLRPFCIAGQNLLHGRNDKELVFAIAKELSFFRPEHFILRVVPQLTPGLLKVLLFAAMKLVAPQLSLPGIDPASVDQYVKVLQKFIQPTQLPLLQSLSKKLMENPGAVDLTQWLTAAELTANRAGFVVCNDLPVAANVLRQMDRAAVPVGGLSLEQKIGDLVLYSVSEEYFEVRRQLGLTIAQ